MQKQPSKQINEKQGVVQPERNLLETTRETLLCTGSYLISKLVVLLAMIGVHVLYVMAYYYLMTTNNPFNFDNNYYLIAYASYLTFMVNLTLLALFVSGRQGMHSQVNAKLLPVSPDAHFLGDGVAYFVAVLLLVTLTVLPITLYLLLLDDFVVHAKLAIPLGFWLGLFFYSYWGMWGKLVEKQGGIRRLFFFLLFVLLILLTIELLTEIIPSPLKTGSENAIIQL